MQKEAVVWLALAGLTRADIAKLTGNFNTLPELAEVTEPELIHLGLSPKKINRLLSFRQATDPIQSLHNLTQQQIKALLIEEEAYPSLLKQSSSAPGVLFYKGKLASLTKPGVAVVGTRKPTGYGRAVTKALVADLVKAGIVIVSGLAYGIDTMAHQAAIDAGGETVAVLGNGIDSIQPQANHLLGQAIIEQGLILSEYPPGYPALKQHFPARNRIVAGLASLTLVIEGDLGSGSMITARFAQKYKRPVMAVPGLITNPLTRAPHQLIQQGATLVTQSQDILEVLGKTQTQQKQGYSWEGQHFSTAEETLLKLIKSESMSVDELVRSSGMATKQVMGIVSSLELNGVLVISDGLVCLVP